MTEIRTLVIGLLLLGGITMGLTTFSGALFTEYGIENPDNLTTFNLAQNISALANDTTNKLYEKSLEEPDIITVFWSFGANAINSLTIIATSSAFYQNLIGDSVRVLHLPGWVATIAIGGITLFILFALISALMKWRV